MAEHFPFNVPVEPLMLEPSGSGKTIQIHFKCNECGRIFQRNIHRLFVDITTFVRALKQKEIPNRSPYLIPHHVVCLQCGAINRNEITLESKTFLVMNILAFGITDPEEEHPIKAIEFSLHDGSLIHPLDALKWYAERLSKEPKNLSIRMRYANVLRTIGRLEEAETEYQIILKDDISRLEAWLNLAAIYVARNRNREARHYLEETVAHAPKSSHPDQEVIASYARGILKGEARIEDLTPEKLFLNSHMDSTGTPTMSQ